MIKIRNLVKYLGGRKILKNISFDVHKNEIFGLAGPNGAGKTTLLLVLSTVLLPDKGEIKIGRYDIRKDSAKIREIIGVVFQENLLEEELTVSEYLQILGRLYFDKKKVNERVNAVMNLLNIKKYASSYIRTLSGGMKRRVEIARALLHKPHLLFLDEPTSGLDPKAKRSLWNYIKKIKKTTTIVLASNNMEEIEICDRVAIINKGKVIKIGEVKKLKSFLGNIIEIEPEPHVKPKIPFPYKKINNNFVIYNARRNMIPKIKNYRRLEFKKASFEDVFYYYVK